MDSRIAAARSRWCAGCRVPGGFWTAIYHSCYGLLSALAVLCAFLSSRSLSRFQGFSLISYPLHSDYTWFSAALFAAETFSLLALLYRTDTSRLTTGLANSLTPYFPLKVTYIALMLNTMLSTFNTHVLPSALITLAICLILPGVVSVNEVSQAFASSY